MLLWVDKLIYFLLGATFFMLIMEIWVALIMPGIERWSRCYVITINASFLLCLSFSLLDISIYMNPKLVWLESITVFMEYFLFSVLIPILSFYLIHCAGEDWRHNKLAYAAIFLWGIFFILLVIAQFSDSFYYLTPDNAFHRGPCHFLLMIPFNLLMFLNIIYLFYIRDRISRKYFRAFCIYMFPSAVITFLQLFFVILTITDLSMAICSLVMYGLIMSDQVEQYMRQRKEIEQQRANIMVLQMRPHFIYNTMTSIYYLCEQNPRKAQQVTLDFTTYLRKNFTAVASEKMIPFSEELAHTRAYLAVEQAQFENSLFVEYDIPHTLFRLPPLTLQPIVENSVKHGMDPDADPLRIFIRTREFGTGSEIIVEDNGSGFDTEDASGNHMALDNIKQRLELMCRGKMTIMPRKGGGTAVKVVIP